jgi:hypothetical protein
MNWGRQQTNSKSQAVVARQAGCHSRAFSADRGVKQGDIPSPTIFNIIVDAIVREWESFYSGILTVTEDERRALMVGSFFMLMIDYLPCINLPHYKGVSTSYWRSLREMG